MISFVSYYVCFDQTSDRQEAALWREVLGIQRALMHYGEVERRGMSWALLYTFRFRARKL